MVFVFLRFEDSKDFLCETAPTTKAQLIGLERQLGSIGEYLGNINYKTALNSCAAKKGFIEGPNFGGILACGKPFRSTRDGIPKLTRGGTVDDVVFICPYRLPRKVWVERDDSGKIIKKHLDKPDKIEYGNEVNEEVFGGCEFWKSRDKSLFEKHRDILTENLRSKLELYEN